MIFFNTTFNGDKVKVIGNYLDVQIDGDLVTEFQVAKITKHGEDVTETLGTDIDLIREGILDDLIDEDIMFKLEIEIEENASKEEEEGEE